MLGILTKQSKNMRTVQEPNDIVFFTSGRFHYNLPYFFITYQRPHFEKGNFLVILRTCQHGGFQIRRRLRRLTPRRARAHLYIYIYIYIYFC